MDASDLPCIPIDPRVANEAPLDFEQEENILKFVRPSRWVSVDVCGFRLLRINWVVTIMASLVLWAFVIYVAVSDETKDSGERNPALVEFGKWQSWVTQNFTWLYIGTQDAWMVFVLWIAQSKYGGLKLGKDDEKPEWHDFEWFAMLFTTGIAVGLYFFGVAEPMYYYRTSYNQPLQKPGFHYQDDYQRANQAMFITFYHWGFHAWACYILAALTLGIVCYRWNLPMTIRSAFYPLVGDVANGLLGDFIDALSMACTTFGVCTSLGLGVQNILMGMHRLSCGRGYNCQDAYVPPNDGSDKARDWIICIIAVITCIASISVVSGLKRGIWLLSQFAFVMGTFTLVALLFLDNTWFLLNSYVQAIGYYLQYIIVIGFETDTWQQLNLEWLPPGLSDYGQNNYLWGSGPETMYTPVTQAANISTLPKVGTLNDYFAPNGADGNMYFMDYWTIFYWGWWISWVPFVGMFIAKISRGRTIKEVVFGALLAPIVYSFFYLTVLGSLGIKMERIMETALGVKANIETGKIDCAAMGYSGGEPDLSLANGLAAQRLAEIGYYAIPCRAEAMRYFDVLTPYGHGIGQFLTVMSLIGITVYFITSSDSGSFIDDTLSAGGMDSPPVLQRVYWAWTEGALAMTIMYYGGTNSMKALRSISIVSGMPYTIAMCFMCTALLRACKFEFKEDEIMKATRFTTGLWDWTEGFRPASTCRQAPSFMDRIISLVISIFCPAYECHKMHVRIYDNPLQVWFWTTSMVLCQISWIVCWCVNVDKHNAVGIGWTFFFFLVVCVMITRANARKDYNIYGWVLEDFFSSLVMLPFVASQMGLHAMYVEKPDLDEKFGLKKGPEDLANVLTQQLPEVDASLRNCMGFDCMDEETRGTC
jgi:choline-glycine betaine transporter